MIRSEKLVRGSVMAIFIGAMGFCLAPAQGVDECWKPSGKETSESLKARTRAINRPKEVGTYYEATVPDTLDLAERARYGINHFTSIISEKDNYEMYWRADFDNYNKADGWAWPGYMWFQCSPLMACQPKALEAMAMDRLMSGSQQNLEREARMMEMMVSALGDEGLYWVLPSAGKKPWLGPEDIRPYAHVHGQGRMMRAMIAWYQYTGDPAWKARIDRMVNAWDTLMVAHKDDYAYVPLQGWVDKPYLGSCYIKGRGWKSTEEPAGEREGQEEGSLTCHQGHWPGVLANWYLLTGNEQALRLSGELTRFLTKPKFWADWKGGEYPGVVGAEHAHWEGHLHGYANALLAILEYAIAANDQRLKLFAREGYEWTRQNVLMRIGFLPNGHGAAIGRLLALAIKLTDAGVGDYWEDVDLYIRNQGVELQITPEDIPHIRDLIRQNPNPPRPKELITDYATGTSDGVAEASVGGFGLGYHPYYKNGWALWCDAWGNYGIFYAWDAALRHENGIARVNLLLNRASPWMDVDSYIPYEGKVILKNKQAREALVRIPLYVDLKDVTCRIGRRTVQLRWFGRYLRVEGLKAGEEVTIEFPLEERTERWAATSKSDWYGLPLPAGTVCTMKFKGNTLITISPSPGPGCRLYENRAEKYKAAKAPMKKIIRHATPLDLKW